MAAKTMGSCSSVTLCVYSGMGLQGAAHHRVHGQTHTLYYDSGVALVCVHDLEPTPVPELHIHLAEAILMIASNNESPPYACQFTRQIKRRLLAYGFDDPLTSRPPS